MGSSHDARVEREREFHDARFANGGGRRRSSAFYDIARPSRRFFEERISEIPSGSRVLELGCGPDSAAWELWERGVEVDGIDISANAIDAARDRARQRGIDPAHFRVGNAEAPDFAPGSFDAVIGSSILHHLDLQVTLPRVHRLLAPAGHAIFYEPLGRNPAIRLYRRLTPSERSEDEHPLVEADLEMLRREFADVEVEYFHLSSLAAAPLIRTRAFEIVSSRLEMADRWLLNRAVFLRSYSWVAVIRCST